MNQITFSLPDDAVSQLQTLMLNTATEAFKQAAAVQRLPEKWLNLGQAAAYAGVSRGTLTKFINQGLKVATIGENQRISKDEIDRFLIEHQI